MSKKLYRIVRIVEQFYVVMFYIMAKTSKKYFKEDYETKEWLLLTGQFSVPLDRWDKQLDEMFIEYKEISVKYGSALVIIKS